eukprot:3937594-Rhodomonas_salina.1
MGLPRVVLAVPVWCILTPASSLSPSLRPLRISHSLTYAIPCFPPPPPSSKVTRTYWSGKRGERVARRRKAEGP